MKLKEKMTGEICGGRIFAEFRSHHIERFFRPSESDIGRADIAVFLFCLLDFELITEQGILLREFLGG